MHVTYLWPLNCCIAELFKKLILDNPFHFKNAGVTPSYGSKLMYMLWIKAKYLFFQEFHTKWSQKCHGEKYKVDPKNICSVIQYLSEVRHLPCTFSFKRFPMFLVVDFGERAWPTKWVISIVIVNLQREAWCPVLPWRSGHHSLDVSSGPPKKVKQQNLIKGSELTKFTPLFLKLHNSY